MKTYPGILIVCLLLASCSGNGSESRNQKVSAEQFLLHGNTQHAEYLGDAATQTLDIVYSTRSGHAEFISQADGTVGIFMAESGGLNGSIDFRLNSIELSLDLRTLRTGIAQRDPMVFKTLDVDQFPIASFAGTFEPPFDQYSDSKQPVTATGQFTIHGVTRDLKLEGYLLNDGNRIMLEAEWILDISEYGISTPRIYSVKINDETEIRIEASLEPQWLASLSGSI